MATTLSDMINEVLINLSGYTYAQDRATYLKTAVTTTTSSSDNPTILSLGSTENVGKGTLEIDEELMWVDSFDRISNTATISPYGRGYLGTAPDVHSKDAKVTISPTFPRYVIKRAINDAIRAASSSLMTVKTTTFTYQSPVTTYAFNNLDIVNILSMSWQTIGPSKEWVPLRHWTWDSAANSAAFGEGAQSVTIGDYITPGRTVKVIYSTNATPFTSNTQDFSTQTGLEDSTKDLIILGASYRLITYLDPARASVTSPQADETDSKRPYGSSQTATKQLYALYTQRLNEEVQRQQKQYPIRVHYSR